MNNIICIAKKAWNNSTKKQKAIGISTGLLFIYLILPIRHMLIAVNLTEIESELPTYRAKILSNSYLSESEKQNKLAYTDEWVSDVKAACNKKANYNSKNCYELSSIFADSLDLSNKSY
ncbi:MAG: hypothetical protein HC939_23475 [Pleurocapsa sp. SU_5_0]|nr:hypothetical protein [Pleurocapsa sp. SU_5_0]